MSSPVVLHSKQVGKPALPDITVNEWPISGKLFGVASPDRTAGHEARLHYYETSGEQEVHSPTTMAH